MKAKNKYDFLCELIMVRPNNQSFSSPSQDIVKWFHILLDDGRRFTCEYEIISSNEEYNKYFEAKGTLLQNDMIEALSLNKLYKIFRGPEEIGTLRIKQFL